MDVKVKLNFARYILILASILVIIFATKYSLANLTYLKVDSYLIRWQESNSVKKDELNDALNSVETMLSLHGHFPHYLNIAAKVYEWQAFSKSGYNSEQKMDSVAYKKSLHQALHYYELSTQLRAHWPLTWVFMANVKSNLHEIDDDFYYYIEQAIKYGPYTHEVNLQVAKLQLLYWGNLQKLPKKEGLEQIKRALLNSRSRYLLLSYSAEINKQHIVCTVARLHKIAPVLKNRVCRTS